MFTLAGMAVQLRRNTHQGDPRKLDGSLVLDKITWLGDTTQITELLLALTVQFDFNRNSPLTAD